MFARSLVYFFLFVASSTEAGHVVRGVSKANMREDWIITTKAPENKMHEMIIAVKQNNIDILEKQLLQISDPKSKHFGKHLSFDQVGAIIENGAALKEVLYWLGVTVGAEIISVSPHGEYVRALAPLKLWNQALKAPFYTYVRGDGAKINRASSYSVPEDISDSIHGIYNTIDFPPRSRHGAPILKRHKPPQQQQLRGGGVVDVVAAAQGAATATKPAPRYGSSGTIFPAILSAYYNIDSNEGSPLASQAVFETGGQNFSPDDLSTFQKRFLLPSEAVAHDTGGYNSSALCGSDPNDCGEANLDVQYIMAVAQHVPTTYWYEANEQAPFATWIASVAADASPPLVHSISYGSIEVEMDHSLMESFNTEAMKLGLRGVTVLVSSGDDGVANFWARYSPGLCAYSPSFPASSPYVTAVGATQGPENGFATEEIACQSNAGGVITTGGGFSTYFAQPSYQAGAVQGYFTADKVAPVEGYAAEGRGYPDLSLLGHNYEVVIGGSLYEVSGTSASSPALAGMVSLINSKRLEKMKSPLGFLNPSIYAYADQFAKDVTSGHNRCTAGGICCDEGFEAVEGWDPVTGFGSVDFGKMANILVEL